MKKIFVVFGTRPEAIKMAPVIKQLKKKPDRFQVVVCVTGQHRQMLDQITDWFSIAVDYDLDLMRDNQFVSSITINALQKIEEILGVEEPEMVLVQGIPRRLLSAPLPRTTRKYRLVTWSRGSGPGTSTTPFPKRSTGFSLAISPTCISLRRRRQRRISSGRG